MRSSIVQLALGYGAGLWVGLVFLIPTGATLILAVGVVAGLSYGRWGGLIAGAFLLGVGSGSCEAALRASSCGSVWEPGDRVVAVQLHDRPGRRGITTANVIHSFQGCRGELQLRFDSEDVPGGSRLLVAGRHRGHGMLRVQHYRLLSGGRHRRYALREAVGRRIQSLYGPRSGIVEALVLGRRTDIDPVLRQRFTSAGLAHVLAISGLHVGVLASWISLLARLVVGSRGAWLVSAGLVWCYVGLLGFPAAATRAAAFISVYGCARARQRHPPVGAVLAVALLVVLSIDPAAATSVGAWLSASAVLGTRFGADALPRFKLLGASLGATLATSPITAFVFGAVAPVGVVANLVAIPAAAVAVPGLFLSVFFGSIPASGTGIVLAALEWTARLSAGVPGGHLTGDAGVRFAGPWMAMLLFVLWLKRRGPSRRRIRVSLMAGVAAASWVFAAGAVSAPRYGARELAVHFLSVGQGDAALVRTPGGAWVLVDGGPRTAGFDAGRQEVLPLLRRHRVRELAAVIVSHGDADHLGGVPSVVREVNPRLVLDPGQPQASSLYLEYLEVLDRVGAEWYPARKGDSFRLDSVRFNVLHPSSEWLATNLEPNGSSVVVRMEYGCFSALFMGDIEWPAESLLVPSLEEADLLKVSHHGAPGGTSDALLDAVRPRAAVISVGRNGYGHPALSTLERLTAHDVSVWRTDLGGTVTARSDGSYLELTQSATTTPWEVLKCLIRRWLRSRGSSSNRKSCTPTPPVSLPSCSTTSRLPRR